MSKILMIDNEWSVREKIHDKIWQQRFGGHSRIDTQQAKRIIDEVFDVLKDYELKAIEFEAEITTIPFRTGHIVEARSWLAGIRIPVDVMEQLKPQGGDKHQVFVVPKEEKTDEKDVPHS